MSETIEIRWHGRGGQGTVTAAKVLADACLSTGKNVQAFPEYGPERAGAPLRAYNRISTKELRVHCPVLQPNVVIVADPTLIESINVIEGAPEDAIVIVNTAKDPSEIRKKTKAKGSQKVVTIDATRISLETIGRNLPNSCLLGSLVKVAGIVPLDTLLEDIRGSFGSKFSDKIITGNLDAAKRGYEEVKEG